MGKNIFSGLKSLTPYPSPLCTGLNTNTKLIALLRLWGFFQKHSPLIFWQTWKWWGQKKWQEFANVFQIFQEGLAKFPSPGQIIGPKRQEWMSWQWKCWRIPKVVKVTILQRKLSSIYIFSNHLWKRSANSAHDSCAKSIYKNLLEYMWYKDDTKAFMDLFFYYSPRLSWNLGVNYLRLSKKCSRTFLNFATE